MEWNNSPNRQAAIFFAILVGLFMFMVAPQETLVLAILGGILYTVWRIARASDTQVGWSGRVTHPLASLRRDDEETVEEQFARQPEAVYKHALESVRRAGLNPDTMQVLPVDVGVMAYSGDNDPVIHRTYPVPDSVEYLQPYVQLRLPIKAAGRVRFEIRDSSGEVVFVHEDKHELSRGRNLIVPPARLPVRDLDGRNGVWEMRISADNVPLATYRFGWEEDAASAIRKHIGEDGEITSEMRLAIAEEHLEKMSLDDLLSSQQEDEPPQRARR
jgi:hypothetical protein